MNELAVDNNIPTLTPNDLKQHHGVDDNSPLPPLASDHHLFHFNRLEDYRCHMKFPLPPHRKTVFDFIFLTKGSSTRSKGLDNYTFSAHSFFFLPAFQITSHDWMSQDAEGYFCHFDPLIIQKNYLRPDFTNDFTFLQFTANPIIQTNDTFPATVQSLFDKLEEEYQLNMPYKLDLVSFCLMALFTELKRFTHNQIHLQENACFRITRLYKEALSCHIYDKQTVAEYASLLAISPNHLNKCVKSTTGKSAQSWLNEMILLEAKVLLRQTDLPIADIAQQTTRQNPSDFSRFFRREAGLTPREYKKLT